MFCLHTQSRLSEHKPSHTNTCTHSAVSHSDSPPPPAPPDLNLSSMQLWQQQHSDLSHFCGCLMLHDERPVNQDPLYPSQYIPPGAQLQGLEPGLNPDLANTCQHAKLYTQEGWCDPVEATAAFLADAAAAGAAVKYRQKVCDTVSTTVM
jgi:glycine/D-amino acid oxidase-like deaminating enzyme